VKQIVPVVLTALMLTSLFAGIDFADELKDTNEMETGGRAAYELNLHDVLEPRETFVDQAGNIRNGIDIGDIVYFRPIIINDGDDAHNEFNIQVSVTPAGDGQTAVIDNLDDAVCPGSTAVTGCSFNTLASGDFLGGGNYRIQAASGGDLSWSPTIAGEYIVTISVDVDGSMDTDLTNNDITYSVTVQHYRDIVVDLCWTDSPGGDCLVEGDGSGPYGNVQGTGPHNFAVMVTADGSEAWAPRSTTVTVEFNGDYDTDPTTPSRFDTDGSGPNTAETATAGGHMFTVVVGQTESVHVWHNLSTLDDPVTDTNDLVDNPCATGANPCAQDRTVMTFQQVYSYHGEIVGDPGADMDPSESVATFSITALLSSFDSYEPAAGAAASGPGGESSNPSLIMNEQTMTFDDRSGNNAGTLSGAFSVFHDIGVTSLTAGDNEATEGTLNVGVTMLYANVVFGGSEQGNAYDWELTFTVIDGDGNDLLMGAGIASDCLSGEEPYSHALLGQGGQTTAFPEGTACLDVDLPAGRYTVSATVSMLSENSEPTSATDQNSGNNVRATFYEVINDNPSVYMTLDSITRGDDSVDAPIIIGDWVTLRARGMDTETDDMDLMYSWKRVTIDSVLEDMADCLESICNVMVDETWVGERMVTVSVTDAHGSSASDSLLMSVWNTYYVDMNVTGATMSYSLVYGPDVLYNVSATDADALTGEQLGNNAGSFDSIVAFDLDVTNVFMPADAGTEWLTIDFEGDATMNWGLWFKRTTESPWVAVNHVTSTAGANGGTTMTYTHDGSMEGNLAGGTYAIFEVSTSGAEPPAAGVEGLTATLQPDAAVKVSWDYGENPQFATGDTVNIYWCAGENCDVLGENGTSIAGQTPGNSASEWTHIGMDAAMYTIMVQTENGNVDVMTGAKLTGGSMSVTMTADGSVSPAPTLSNAAATVTSTDDGLTFTWDATGTDDVSSWVLCWAGTQDIVNNDFDSLLGNSCATTEDTTTSITVTEAYMCGTTCTTDMYFGIAGKDTTGNVADPGVDMYADMSAGLEEPGVIDPADPGAEDDTGIGNAIYAIIGLVVLAVIGGAFILTRGAEADGDEKEWDY
jgi:hypothetical protein